MHHADRQRQQRKLLALTLAIGCDEAAGFQVFAAVEASALALEVVEQLVQAFAPVFRAEYQQEIITANMADEVAGRVDAVVQALRQAQQDFVAATIAVDVVLRPCEKFVQNAPVQLVEGVHCLQAGFICRGREPYRIQCKASLGLGFFHD
ncbi:hypothetical protein D3C86_883660 [compost metagenome]